MNKFEEQTIYGKSWLRIWKVARNLEIVIFKVLICDKLLSACLA